jgi:hypothetical protein
MFSHIAGRYAGFLLAEIHYPIGTIGIFAKLYSHHFLDIHHWAHYRHYFTET